METELSPKDRARAIGALHGLFHYSHFTSADDITKCHIILGTLEMNGFEIRRVKE